MDTDVILPVDTGVPPPWTPEGDPQQLSGPVTRLSIKKPPDRPVALFSIGGAYVRITSPARCGRHGPVRDGLGHRRRARRTGPPRPLQLPRPGRPARAGSDG